MTKNYLRSLDAGRHQAIGELTNRISERYPGSTFMVEPGIDNPEATHVTAVVDLDDPDEVMDLVIDRLVELQVDQGIPVSVIPIRTAERVAQLEQQRRRERLGRAFASTQL
jgi:hypothetical protein